jgi:hypothetical protein
LHSVHFRQRRARHGSIALSRTRPVDPAAMEPLIFVDVTQILVLA